MANGLNLVRRQIHGLFDGSKAVQPKLDSNFAMVRARRSIREFAPEERHQAILRLLRGCQQLQLTGGKHTNVAIPTDLILIQANPLTASLPIQGK